MKNKIWILLVIIGILLIGIGIIVKNKINNDVDISKLEERYLSDVINIDDLSDIDTKKSNIKIYNYSGNVLMGNYNVTTGDLSGYILYVRDNNYKVNVYRVNHELIDITEDSPDIELKFDLERSIDYFIRESLINVHYFDDTLPISKTLNNNITELEGLELIDKIYDEKEVYSLTYELIENIEEPYFDEETGEILINTEEKRDTYKFNFYIEDKVLVCEFIKVW